MKWLRSIGPGLLVTAAFVGPGTVTVASTSGASFGYALVWALVFSVVATIGLQEMSARLGLAGRQDLGEAIRSSFANPTVRWLAIALVLAAIGFGNAAYQTGNITGAALGLESLTAISHQWWSLLVGVSAFGLLAWGSYRPIQSMLVVLVVAMSFCFVLTAVVVRPDVGQLTQGLVPRVNSGNAATVMALIGTTVVPYNLFLHSSLVRKKWDKDPIAKSLPQARLDTVLSIGVGGIISLAIMITSAAVFHARGIAITSATDMADQLKPLLGQWALGLFALGLFAAGLSSSITAPLAAALACRGALGWPAESWRFRAVWATILVIGTTLASIGYKPLQAITLAQAANGLLLPLVAVFLLIVVNRRKVMGPYANGPLANIMGAIVVSVTIAIGLRSIWRVIVNS